jgi:phenylalanyl-tRNA synthetase beta chain
MDISPQIQQTEHTHTHTHTLAQQTQQTDTPCFHIWRLCRQGIARSARRHKLPREASRRFERGVDASLTALHIEHITRLIQSICGGEAGPIDDQSVAVPERQPVTLRASRAAQVIGMPLSTDDCRQALARLGLDVKVEGDRLTVLPPPHRFDLAIEEDLIEEVVRLWGFERLPVRPPRAASPMLPHTELERPVGQLRRAMAARDFQEVITFGFVAGTLDERFGQGPAIRLLNPIAAHLDVMRTTLWAGLLDTLRTNLNRKAGRVRLFEIGRVFRADQIGRAHV